MDEVRQLASKNMAENMSEMEEKTAEVRRVTCSKMAGMEEKVVDMACKISRATHCIKS